MAGPWDELARGPPDRGGRARITPRRVRTPLPSPQKILKQTIADGAEQKAAGVAADPGGGRDELAGQSMRTANQSVPGWTVVLRRISARIVAGQPEGGYTNAFEIVCCDCGDGPDLDYRDVSPELQHIRGPYQPLAVGVAAYEKHVARRHDSGTAAVCHDLAGLDGMSFCDTVTGSMVTRNRSPAQCGSCPPSQL